MLGAVAVGIGALLRRLIAEFTALTKWIDDRTSWWLSAAIFGGVLGVLYLIGGPTVQFTGSGVDIAPMHRTMAQCHRNLTDPAMASR